MVFNPYSIANLVTGILFLLLGVFVFSKNPKGLPHRIFAGLCFVSMVWQLCNTLAYNLKDYSTVNFLLKLSYSSVVMISPFAGHYGFIIARADRKFKAYIRTVYILGIFFVLFIPTSTLVIGDIRKYFWGYYPLSGPLNPLFLLYFIGNLNVSLFVVAFQFIFNKKLLSSLQINQLKLFFVGFAIYCLACADFIPQYGIELYPFGYIPAFLFICIIGFTIVRYRFMEIDTVIHKTLLWLSTVLLLVLPAAALEQLLTLAVLKNLQASTAMTVNIIFATIYFLLFVAYYSRLRPHIDHFFRRRKYDYQTILGKVAEKIATAISIEELTRQLLNEVCETMYLRNALLYVLAKDDTRYVIMGRRGYKEVNGIRQRTALELYDEEERKQIAECQREISCSSLLAKWFAKEQDILEKAQVEVDPKYQKIKEEALTCFDMHDVEVVVPVVVQGKVNAILGLGKKENLQAYTIKDLELLKKLGQEAGVTVFNALHYEELAETERLEEEMKMGRQIQMALLPHESPEIARLNARGLMQPAKEIGGDYYDFVTLPDKDKLAIVIGDVSGKGVAAGLLMSMVKATIQSLSQEGVAPKRLLMRINQMLYQNIQAQKFMTLLYFIWQAENRTLIYSSAGHEHILIYRNNAQVIESIQSGGFMLGMLPDIETYLEEKQIKLESQDKILLYTDGVTEAQNDQEDRFGLSRLTEVFRKHNQKPAQELMQTIKDEVYSFMGSQPQYDDITLVVLEAQ